MSKIIETWYKILKSIKAVQCDNPYVDEIGDVKYWIKKIPSGKYYSDNRGGKYKLYKYEVYDHCIERCNIIEMNLECLSIEDIYSDGTYFNTSFLMKDFYGNSKTVTKGSSPIYLNLENVVKYMKEVGNYKSWEAIEVYEINKRLLEENTSLKEKVKRLESKIKELKLDTNKASNK